MSKLVKSTHYSFRDKSTMTGLHLSGNWAHHRFNKFICDGIPLPADEKLDDPLALFAGRSRFYDIYQDWIVSEKIATVLREQAGQHIKLWPINIDTNIATVELPYPLPPSKRFPLTQPYYFLQVPVVECCLYTYGDPMPTDDSWKESVRQLNKGLQEKGVGPEYMKTLTETAIPITSITLDQDKIKDLPIFRTPLNDGDDVFCTDTIMRALKKAKVYGMDIEPHEYCLERWRKVQNQSKGIEGLIYNMPVV